MTINLVEANKNILNNAEKFLTIYWTILHWHHIAGCVLELHCSVDAINAYILIG